MGLVKFASRFVGGLKTALYVPRRTPSLVFSPPSRESQIFLRPLCACVKFASLKTTFSFLVLLVGFCPWLGLAASQDLQMVKQVLQKYADAGSVSMKFEKKMHFELLGRSETQSGRILVSQGRAKVEHLKPHKMLMVLDDKQLWIEKPMAGLAKSSKLQVIKLPFVKGGGSLAGATASGGLVDLQKKLSAIKGGGDLQKKLSAIKGGAALQNQLLSVRGGVSPLQQFLKDKTLWDKIKLLPPPGVAEKFQSVEGERVYFIDPRQVPQLQGWLQLRVHIQLAKKQITRLFFKNKLGNTTDYSFSAIKFSSRKQSITYTPPRGAEVIEN